MPSTIIAFSIQTTAVRIHTSQPVAFVLFLVICHLPVCQDVDVIGKIYVLVVVVVVFVVVVTSIFDSAKSNDRMKRIRKEG